MRIVATLFALAMSLAAGMPAAAQTGPDRLSDPTLEVRAVALQKELRCLVCQGESLDESNAPLAADLRRRIRELLKQGDSDAEVENYLVARYGDFILMKPPLEPETYLLWFGPLIVVSAGAFTAGWAILRARGNIRAGTPD
jgi:cytochrome c-type biogenesis protein CcmH